MFIATASIVKKKVDKVWVNLRSSLLGFLLGISQIQLTCCLRVLESILCLFQFSVRLLKSCVLCLQFHVLQM